MIQSKTFKTIAVTAAYAALLTGTAFAAPVEAKIGPNGELLANGAVSSSDYTSGTGVSGSNNVARYKGNAIDDPTNRGTTGRDVITGRHGSTVGVGTESPKQAYSYNTIAPAAGVAVVATPLTIDQIPAVNGRVIVQGNVAQVTGTDQFVLQDYKGNTINVWASSAAQNLSAGKKVNVSGQVQASSNEGFSLNADNVTVLN